MSHFEDVFIWNYWEPLYPGDVVRDQPLRLAHWVATHPYRDYQAGEVSEFVEAYHSGLVFTKADIERLVRSNQRMWQAEDEEWRNSDFLVNRAAVPEWEPSDPAQHGYPRSTGTLWASLTEFDQTLAALGDGDAGNPNLVRQHAEAVAEFDWPVPSVRYLNLGCVLSSSVVAGELAHLVSKARASGHLRIVLTDVAGTDEIGTLFAGDVAGGIDGIEGLTIRERTADVAPGSYRIRWIYRARADQEHQDYLITVR